jgi:hypothetical protein
MIDSALFKGDKLIMFGRAFWIGSGLRSTDAEVA